MTKLYDKFLGKICTILIDPAKFPFKLDNPKKHAEFFTGLVVGIDNAGILIKNLNTNAQAYYAFPIIGIIEEQVVAKTDPNYEKIKDELEQKKKPAPVPPKPAPPLNLSLEDMTKMAKQIKANRTQSGPTT